MSGKHALEVVATILTRFGAKSINLLVFIVTARYLAIEDMATYGMVFSLTLIYSTVLDVGVRNSLAVFVGNSTDKADAYLKQAFLVWLLLAPLSFPIMYFSVEASDQSDVVASSGILLASMLYLRMLQGALLGQGEIALFNRTELASRVLLLLGTGLILFAPGGVSLSNALWVLAFSQLGGALYLFSCQRRAIFQRNSDATLAWQLVSRGFIFMLSVLLMHVAKRASFLVISQIATTEDSATFFALQRLTEALTEVGMAVSVVMFSRNVRAKSHLDAARETAQSSRLTLVVLGAAAVALGLLSRWLVPLALGPQYAGNDALFNLLLVSTLAGVVWVMLFPSMAVATSPSRVLLTMLPGATLSVTLAYLLGRSFGVMGAAWATLLSSLVTSYLFLLSYKAKYGLRVSDFIVPRYDDVSSILRRRKAR